MDTERFSQDTIGAVAWNICSRRIQTGGSNRRGRHQLQVQLGRAGGGREILISL
jgi:hypothetical protein